MRNKQMNIFTFVLFLIAIAVILWVVLPDRYTTNKSMAHWSKAEKEAIKKEARERLRRRNMPGNTPVMIDGSGYRFQLNGKWERL